MAMPLGRELYVVGGFWQKGRPVVVLYMRVMSDHSYRRLKGVHRNE